MFFAHEEFYFTLIFRDGPKSVLDIWEFVLLSYLLCQLREYSGETKVEHLNVASFERRVKIGATKDEETKKWLVMFYAPWHPPCNQFDPTFAQLSLDFQN